MDEWTGLTHTLIMITRTALLMVLPRESRRHPRRVQSFRTSSGSLKLHTGRRARRSTAPVADRAWRSPPAPVTVKNTGGPTCTYVAKSWK